MDEVYQIPSGEEALAVLRKIVSGYARHFFFDFVLYKSLVSKAWMLECET